MEMQQTHDCKREADKGRRRATSKGQSKYLGQQEEHYEKKMRWSRFSGSLVGFSGSTLVPLQQPAPQDAGCTAVAPSPATPVCFGFCSPAAPAGGADSSFRGVKSELADGMQISHFC